MKETFAQWKELGSALTGLSAWGYIAGYLSLRAKAHAFGTNPAFKLVDEAYVFAGFRVVFLCLIVMLLSAPLLLPLDRWLARIVSRCSARVKSVLAWTVLGAAGVLTLYSLRILSCSSVLLGSQRLPGCTATLEAAIIGGRGAVAWIFIATLLPIVCALGLRQGLRLQQGSFARLLGILVALQLCLLPIYHGALFADRKVRVLSTGPSTTHALVDPIGVIDQSNDYATLYGLDSKGHRALVVVKQDDLNGLPVSRVVSLSSFVEELAAPNVYPLASAMLAVHLTDGAQGRGAKKNAPSTSTQSNQVSFLQQIVEVLRITFEAIGSLGESPVTSGELWEARIDAQGAVTRRRIGQAPDLAWPVGQVGSDTIWALRAGRLVTLSATGDVRASAFAKAATWHKLLGVAPTGSVLGFVVDDDKAVPAILTPEGTVQRTAVGNAPDDAKKLAKLLEESRSYAGAVSLTVDRSARGGRGFDVYLTRAGKRINISDCGDDSCAHASLARDPERVLYIRAPRY